MHPLFKDSEVRWDGLTITNPVYTAEQLAQQVIEMKEMRAAFMAMNFPLYRGTHPCQ